MTDMLKENCYISKLVSLYLYLVTTRFMLEMNPSVKTRQRNYLAFLFQTFFIMTSNNRIWRDFWFEKSTNLLFNREILLKIL